MPATLWLSRIAATLLVLLSTPAITFADGELWIAVAGATWRDGDGDAHVGVGFSGQQPTAQGAVNSALQACAAAGAPGCQAYGPVRGCGFIVVGAYSNGVAYGVGATPDAAIAQVRSAGATSWHNPIGGCGR
jgi:Domain of unknown function (DUF4189)